MKPAIVLGICYMLIVGAAISGCLALDRWIVGQPVGPPTSQPTTRPAARAPADEAISNWMMLLGGIFGVPLVGGIGALWGRAKPLKALRGVIFSVQEGRNRLKAHEPPGSNLLREFDDTLALAQDTKTEAMVRKAKKTLKLASVTDETAVKHGR